MLRRNFLLKEKGLQGSMTIEAACLMPALIFLIWNVFYLSLFLYDQCVILQGSYTSALKAERTIGAAQEKEAAAYTKYELDVRKRVVCAKIQKEQKIEKEKIIIDSVLFMNAPGGMLFQSGWSGRHRQEVKKHEPVQFIRNCRKAERLWDLIGADENS